MKVDRWLCGCGLAAIWAGALSFAVGQGAGGSNLRGGDADSPSSLQVPSPGCNSKDFVREIHDAGSGLRWMLFRNDSHAGAPGRLVLNASRGNADETQGCASGLDQESLPGVDAFREVVIRAGDRLTIQEYTSRVDLRLEGVALTPAANGDAFNVRLRIGGRTVRAIALKPGKAMLAPQAEVWP